MVMTCSFPGCKNRSGGAVGVSFHRYPKNSATLEIWKLVCDAGENTCRLRVCSEHFTREDYKNNRLILTAVPNNYAAVPEEEPQHLKAKILKLEKENAILKKRLTQTKKQNKLIKQSNRSLQNSKRGKSQSLSAAKEIWKENQRYYQNTIQKLKNEKAKVDLFKINAEKIFSPLQIIIITTNQSRANWTSADITKCLGLKCMSTKAYNFIGDEWGFPIPCLRTLRKTLQKFEISTGPIMGVFRMLKSYFEDKTQMQKQVIIAFDEMSISDRICYLEREDRILGPYEKLQLICIRGLFSNFKMSIFLDFDCNVTKDILNTLINLLHEAGIFPRGIINDLGSTNRALLFAQLDISTDKPFYTHEFSDRKIWAFPDMAHLLKLLRNHFLDSGLTMHLDVDKKIFFNKKILEELIDINNTELKVKFKLTHNHLMVENQERQNVRMACQVFSATTAVGITRLSTSPDKIKIADFFQLVNDFWDVSTARIPIHPTNELKSAYGYSNKVENQNEILGKFEHAILNMRVGTRSKVLMPFQKGFIIFIRALIGLWGEMLGENFNPQYLLTSNLRQCFVENIFSQIRGMGGYNPNPSPKECIYRIQSLMLSSLFRALKSSNTVDCSGDGQMAAELIDFLKSEEDLREPSSHYEGTEVEISQDFSDENWSQEYGKLAPEQQAELGGQEHVAGYIARKFKRKYPQMKLSWVKQQRVPSSVEQDLSRGSAAIIALRTETMSIGKEET